MAQYYVLIPAGGRQQDISFGSGAPDVTADTVVLTFDRTDELEKIDVDMALEQFHMFLRNHSFPPV